jgi:hypothetical protein
LELLGSGKIKKKDCDQLQCERYMSN